MKTKTFVLLNLRDKVAVVFVKLVPVVIVGTVTTVELFAVPFAADEVVG